jgi:hypothetical protein
MGDFEERKGCKDGILMGRLEIPTEEELLDPDVAGGQVKIRTNDMNALTYSTNSGGRVASIDMIERSKTVKYPDGNAKVVCKGLKRKYMLKMAPSLTKVRKLFYLAKLKKKVDPYICIGYLEDLRVQMAEMGSSMTDQQFMMHVMNNNTEEYDNQVNKMIEKKTRHEDDPLDIKELVREELRLCFGCLNMKDDDSNSKDKKALFGASHFNACCYQCSKWGRLPIKGQRRRRQKQRRPRRPIQEWIWWWKICWQLQLLQQART